MDPDYWHQRWREGRIGFHRSDVDPQLLEHHAVLSECVRVLVPLCGKTVDLEWLTVHGFEVVGVELSELAVQAFFAERRLTPSRREQGKFVVYQHGNLAIWVGDFFATSSVELGVFDGVYDCAAMIALPAELRARYTAHLQTLLTPKAKMLLVTVHFDAAGGPPFSVPAEEIAAAYSAAEVTLIDSVDARDDIPGALERGATFVYENVYALEFPELAIKSASTSPPNR